MKRFFAIISAGAAFAVFAAEATYRNPVIWADVPDTALCSDGTNVYMVSTTMHLQPGAPVMKSSDMIHWKTVSYVFDEIADGPRYELEDGRTTYGQGQWAASLRFHAGKFWVWFNCNGEPNKGFLYVADKAEGADGFIFATPASTLRAANSLRSSMSAATRPSFRVVLALTPRLIQASSCASFFDLRSQ